MLRIDNYMQKSPKIKGGKVRERDEVFGRMVQWCKEGENGK